MYSVDSKLSEFKIQRSVTGTTQVSDRWTNIQNRAIINFLVLTRDGAIFIDGTDTSGEQKDYLSIDEEKKRNIQLLKYGNIVQIITGSLRVLETTQQHALR